MSQASLQSFAELSRRWREEIDEALKLHTRFDQSCPDRLREAIRYSLLAPGKRLRPLLALMATEACGSDYRRGMPAACAVEMIHAYSLIHDDLPAMDDDDLRRGRPTCHRQFDEATAILAGDALLALSFEVLAKGFPKAEIVGRGVRELAYAAGPCQLVGGQADDLLHQHAAEGDVELLQAIHRRKTGAMITVSLRLGGIVAEADEETLQGLTTYGQCLGLAFQITDDLLDVQGDQQSMGKRVGKDQDRGKMTYPGLWGIEQSRQKAEQLVEEACEALSPIESRSTSLKSLARYVLERNH
ncbi:MAG: polyprenyl synthetase family protein [Pirellulaceae bacterium]